jgi:competence protein ComEA
VKQNFPPAKLRSHCVRITTLSLIVVAVTFSACTTPRRHTLVQTLTPAGNSTVEPNKRININSATARELESLPGIGKVMAERIVAHRQRHGPFRRAEHLMMVDGISDRKFRELRELISTD